MSLSDTSPAPAAARLSPLISPPYGGIRQNVNSGAALRLSDISLSFGGVNALSNVSLHAAPSQLLAIIGPNGAGKSTLLNVISGLYRPDRGEIVLDDRQYRTMKPQWLARYGVARTFQNLALFSGLSVRDNVLQGLAHQRRTSLLSEILGLPSARDEAASQREQALAVMHFFGLEGVADRPIDSLSYGMQKRVELARALVAHPRLLLLDEPMAGMTLADKQQLSALIREIRRHFGTTILLIEHDIAVVMSLSDRVVVLEYGRTIATGTPDEVRQNPAVITAYLGSPSPAAAPEATA